MLAAEEEVRGDREVGSERRILVQGFDSGFQRVLGRAPIALFSPKNHLTLVRLHDT